MRRFNIVAAKKFNKQDGTQGTKWVKIGSMVEKDNKMFGDLDAIPLSSWFDGSISLFENQDNNGGNNSYNNQRQRQPQPQAQAQQGYGQQPQPQAQDSAIPF